MIGKRLSSYEIIEEIGQGGMATVYRAYQANIDRYVAIKVIQNKAGGDVNAAQRFQREARLVARLEHPHILPVYDFDGASDPPYIVMRYLEAGTLKDVFRQGTLPLDEIAYVIRQVAAGVDYAHRQGIIHRDIKPSNIMFDREANAFVTDFGIARITGGDDEDNAITLTGAIVGTPDYMAPEQAMGNVIDHRIDIYALTVILFQMLTGRQPYVSNAPMGVLLMHLNEPVPSAVAINHDLPEAIDEVIQKGMAKQADERYNSATELAEAFIAACEQPMSTAPETLRTITKSIMAVQANRSAEMRTTGTDSNTIRERNRVVTAVYVDVAEYAVMVEEEEGVEVAHAATNGLIDELEKIISHHGGVVFDRSESDLMALWGAEIAKENDVERAIRAALAIQTHAWNSIRKTLDLTHHGDDRENDILPVNIGINTGSVLIVPETDNAFSASGATITTATRLTMNAYSSILVTHDTYSHVIGVFNFEPDDPVKLRGRREKLRVYRVHGIKERAFKRNTRGVEGVETQITGRDAELKHLQDAYFGAIEDHDTQVVTIVGEPGVGKSRLLYEFSNWADLRPEGYRIFRGRAISEMMGNAYALIRHILSFRFEIFDSDSPTLVRAKLENGIATLVQAEDIDQEADNIRLATEMAAFIGHLAGFDFSHSPYLRGILNDPAQIINRARSLFIKLIHMICTVYPVMFQLEDMQWADDASLDLLRELTENDDLPLMIVYAARPGLLERRPNWGLDQDYHTRLSLTPLNKRDSRNLLREILKKMPDIPRELRDFVVDRTEGNPYYMEELVKLLIDERIIQKFDDIWRVEVDRLENVPVPPTLVGLLQTRLDGLLQPERVILQRASVFGRIFWYSAVDALEAADNAGLKEVASILESLQTREFIRQRETTTFTDTQEYFFVHAMMRDLVYESLLRSQQRSYHSHVAEWFVNTAGDRADEYTNIIADHYSRAEKNEKAIAYLTKAGERAVKVGAYQEALAAFQQAYDLSPAGKSSDDYRRLRIALGEVHRNLGDYENAKKHLMSVLDTSTETNSDTRAIALFEISQIMTDEGDLTKAETYLQEALPLARKSMDRTILTRVLYGLGDTAWRDGNLPDASTYLDECLQIARAISDNTQAIYALNRKAVVAAVKQDLETAEALFEESLELAKSIGNRERAGVILGNLGELASLHKNYKDARRKLQEALDIIREVGQQYAIGVGLLNLAATDIKLKNYDEALRGVHELMKMANDSKLMALLLGGVIVYGEYVAAKGSPQRALTLYGMVQSHPAAHSDVIREAEQAIKELKLKQSAVADGLERGKELKLDTIVTEILGQKV